MKHPTLDITTIANGLYRFNLIWPKHLGIRVTLNLTDPDGESEQDILEWVADKDYLLTDAIRELATTIDNLVHWRVHLSSDELSIGPASADYSGTVEIETI